MAESARAGIASPPLLEVDHVRKSFGGGALRRHEVVALDDVSFDLPADRPVIAAIVGESGSGKTTLAHLILGLISPTGGEVRYRGRSIGSLVRRGLAFRRQVQAIFQDPADVFNPFYRVDHVFDMLLGRFHLASSTAEGRVLIRDALWSVGLDPDQTLGRYAHELSGGQAQRVMIARALLLKPSLLVADEPVSMVDASLRAAILETLVHLKETLDLSVLYITHDLATAYDVSDLLFVLHHGRIVERGLTRAVVDAPRHPYTQLLISAVPEPDPDLRWQGQLDDLTAQTIDTDAEAAIPAAPIP